MPAQDRTLRLKFHGKILDQLGFQTYQSPVASIAELVANAWDADSPEVNIELPQRGRRKEIRIVDRGCGMTFKECQDEYFNVGWNRRGNKPEAFSAKGRPILGRKGIGKFAGFGIAEVIRVETVSEKTGERTTFEMDLNYLRSDQYLVEGGEIKAKVLTPSKTRTKRHGTTVVLKSLTLGRGVAPGQFARSMGRRFLLHQRGWDFTVKVNGKPIPTTEDYSKIQFVFPHDYKPDERPDGMAIVNEKGDPFTESGDAEGRRFEEWGQESLSDGNSIHWRVFFYEDTIDEEELQGISIYSNGKLSQKPFFFELFGGLGGQHGMSYISGKVQADYIDRMKIDPISAERQRINFELKETLPLKQWGQGRTRELLELWKTKRGDLHREELEKKLVAFAYRLDLLPPHEAKVVRSVLTRLGGIASLSKKQYEEMGLAILTSWEEGRLRGLITELAESDKLSEEDLVKILLEANTLTALQVAEVAKAKLITIGGLKERISRRDLETAVRDYVARSPWLVSPRWETFKVETSLRKVISDAAKHAGFASTVYRGRVDLVLSSGAQLLVLEFMRPGLYVDWDHLGRFTRYVREIDQHVKSNTAGPFRSPVMGMLVADGLSREAGLADQIALMEKDHMYARDWHGLLDDAMSQWKDFLDVLVRRSDDPRLKALAS
jgi:Histidine kinase-, DNA gyrase B-, and HSP90-like ATPase